jgi:hypothetical protein
MIYKLTGEMIKPTKAAVIMRDRGDKNKFVAFLQSRVGDGDTFVGTFATRPEAQQAAKQALSRYK